MPSTLSASRLEDTPPKEVRRASGRPVEVLYCLDTMRLGGSELNAVRTAERLDRERFRLTVVCFSTEGPLATRYGDAGIPVVRLPVRSLYGASAVSGGLALRRIIGGKRIDIVHSHDMYSNVFAATWTSFARRAALITSRRWWHSLPSARLRLANRCAFRLSDCVLANSSAVASSVQTADGVSPDRIAVVTNFADDSAFTPPLAETLARLREELRIPQDAFVLGSVARLVPVKDHATLLHAVARLRDQLPSLHVVLVGDGPSADPLRELSARLGLERAVTFTGELSNGMNYHHLFDVSVSCSLSEGFPNTVVEAMAAGRPVVATAVGGTADAVVHDLTGILIQPGSVAQLTDAIARLARDPLLRAGMGAQARKRARTHFTAERAISDLESLYERLATRVSA